MKKTLSFAAMFVTAAILGTVLTGAVLVQAAPPDDTEAKAAKPCCQAKFAAAKQADTRGGPGGRARGQGKGLGQSQPCRGGACGQGKQAGLGGKLALAQQDAEANINASRCRGGKCADAPKQKGRGKANATAAKAESAPARLRCRDGQQCQAAGDANCPGKCKRDAETLASTATTTTQKCPLCDQEDCQQECRRGAETRKKAQATEADQATEPGRGRGMGRGPRSGRGSGQGQGPGRGLGPGQGQGLGQGQGPGQGLGQGKGPGQGQGFGQGKGPGQGQGLGQGPQNGRGPGFGRGRGPGRGHASDSQFEKDHKDFFFLIDHRDSIQRTVKNLPNGIETLTESDQEDVAGVIQEHVEAMYDRLETASPIRMRDPLFREIFANAEKIEMEVEHTDRGVKVTETSEDPYVVKLLQKHAKVVSLFIKNGYAELPKNHAAPKR